MGGNLPPSWAAIGWLGEADWPMGNVAEPRSVLVHVAESKSALQARLVPLAPCYPT